VEELNINKRHEEFILDVINSSKVKKVTCKIIGEHTPKIKGFRKTKLTIAGVVFFVVSFEDMTEFYTEDALQ
jgi:hypothetical protein